jgi:hypothetical protein
MNEKQDFYENYSFILTITHHKLVAKQLLSKHTHSWGIVSSYYLFMSIARLLCNIGVNDYPREHGDFFRFLKGDKEQFTGEKSKTRKIRSSIIENVSQFLKNQDLDELLKSLGNDLFNLKEVRNYSNYEHFVIAHQFFHRDIFSPLNRFIRRLETKTSFWFNTVLEIFLCYVDNLTISKQCFSLFIDKQSKSIEEKYGSGAYRWGYKRFLEYNKISGIEPALVKEIEDLWEKALVPYIDELENISADFYDDLTIDKYSSKRTKISEFVQRLESFDI